MQDMRSLVPPGALDDPATAPVELLRALLMRANFIPGVRHSLGWIGVRQCVRGQGGWTTRVQGMPGVYGLAPVRCGAVANGSRGAFNVCYFPHPGEDLVERFSVRGGVLAQDEAWMDAVREFTAHRELGVLFRVASLELRFGPDDALTLALDAPRRHLVVAEDGVEVMTAQGPAMLVQPGGADQDLPAWDTAWPLFRALAASTSFCLGRAPGALERRVRPGRVLHYEASGRAWAQEVPDGQEQRLALGFGCALGHEAMDPEPDAWPVPVEQWGGEGSGPVPEAWRDEPWWDPKVPGSRHGLDKRTLGIQERPRLMVLTGFLGSGKTSLLARFIERQGARNAFVAVIQNEIGRKGLDGSLIGQHYAVTEMDEGCVCCSLAGNLRQALSGILNEFQPDLVVLETTGLANPANLLDEVGSLSDLVIFDTVVTVLDAEGAATALHDFEVARSQVRLADVLVLNKSDLVSEATLAEAEALARRLNPMAPMHRAVHGDLPPGLLDGAFLDRPQRPAPATFIPRMDQATHTDEGLASVLVEPVRPLDRDEFLAWAHGLTSDVLRAKGVLEFGRGPEVFQHVPGRSELGPADDADRADRFLVLIGRGPDRFVPQGFRLAD